MPDNLPKIQRPNHTALINSFEDYGHSYCMWLLSETETKIDGTMSHKGLWIKKEQYNEVMGSILQTIGFEGDHPQEIMKMRVKYKNVRMFDASGLEYQEVVITGPAN